MRRPQSTVFDHFAKSTQLSEQLFDEIQLRMPTLALAPLTRAAIQMNLSVYEGSVTTRKSLRGDIADRKHARRISEYCAKLLQEIAELRKNNPLLAHAMLVPNSLGVQEGDVLSTLEYYQKLFEVFVASAKKGPISRQPQLHSLLQSLAMLYQRSGGISTAVSNSRERSEFIDFAWAIIECLPPAKRPNGRGGLAEEWQICRGTEVTRRKKLAERQRENSTVKKRRHKV